MAWEELQVAPTGDGGEKGFAFEISRSLAAAGSTKDIIMPDDVQGISVTAEASGGATATIYSTTDPVSIVKAAGAGTVTWVPWAAGAVIGATGGVFYPVTALKMTQVGAGASKLTVRAQ